MMKAQECKASKAFHQTVDQKDIHFLHYNDVGLFVMSIMTSEWEGVKRSQCKIENAHRQLEQLKEKDIVNALFEEGKQR